MQKKWLPFRFVTRECASEVNLPHATHDADSNLNLKAGRGINCNIIQVIQHNSTVK